MTTIAAPAASRAPADAQTPALKWGVLGTGAIAKAFAKALKMTPLGELVAVGSRSKESADKFADEFGVKTRHATYEALLADPQVQAVYISTPHPLHAEWAIKAAEAKKHILVEKPIALNHAQASVMIETARVNGVFLMEAFMYRCHPQTAKLVELIKGGAIGQVRMIQATFGFQAGFNPESRLLKNALGGGGILDVGCYAVSVARLIAGAAIGKDYADATDVKGVAKLGTTGVDEYAAAVMSFPSVSGSEPIVAQVATAVQVGLENVVRIWGSEGSIFVPNPWTADREKGGRYVIHVHKRGKPAEEIVVESDKTAFALEAEMVARSVAAGRTEAFAPAMSWGDSLGNMRALDAWRSSIGLVYNDEKFDVSNRPLRGSPVKKRPGANMIYGEIAGVGKPISRMIMGCDNQRTFADAAVIFDEWFERGGNAFDTAYIYGGGHQERLLGQWIRSRGVREQVVVLTKGAHTPHCNPQAITSQLRESLERQGTTYADLYVMHRDNPDIPVGEFVDVLNEHKDAGRIKAFGGSNWSLPRIAEANEYAKKHGKTPFVLVNNNFSLARMVDPVWKGCFHSSDPKSRAWLKEHNMPILSWSSQARGFFTERAGKDKLDDQELVRCWYSDDNWERRRRAYELAEKKGVLPINIAAAYVLTQAFPTFALVGPRNLHELATTLPALEVKLTPEEVEWLSFPEGWQGQTQHTGW